MPRTVHRVCPLCEATCGLTIRVDGATVTDIRGDPDDPFSRGHICPKAVALQDLHDDPDRLRTPVRREGRRWVPLSWPEALDQAAAGLRAVQGAHGRDAVAIYLGNPNVHNLGAMLFGPPLVKALRTRNRYSATSADQLPHQLVAYWLFGHQLLIPVPDVDRTDFMLILGANPAASNGSLMTAPDIEGRLRAIHKRGGQVVLIDPRRTETAALATRHHFIRPGADVLLLAALVHTLFDEALVAPGPVGAFTDGIDRVREAIAPLTPERVEEPTGILARRIRELARALAKAERGVVYGRLGVSTQGFGVACHWLIAVLNLLTGNLDRPGGAMFTTPAIDPLGRIRLTGPGSHGRWRSRVRDLPEVGGELPVATLADEILTPGQGQVRALVTLAGNPVLSTPDGGRLDRALEQLEFMVAIDPAINESSRHADLVLPPVSPLERDHYDLAFALLSVRNVAKWSPRVFDPPEDALDDWQILSGLESRLADGVRARAAAKARQALGPRGLVDLGLRSGPYGIGLDPPGMGLSLGRLEEHVHGLDLGPLKPVLPGRLQTADGRIDLGRAELLAELDRARSELLTPVQVQGGRDLRLIGRRHLRSNNSWMHNSRRLMKGKDRCTLLMHPDDAAARDLADGQLAQVRSRVGEVEVPVELSESMMPGVVSLPHGYGHGRQGVQQSVAREHPGVSMNDLTDAQEIDAVGGTAVLSGVPVAVRPVA